MMAFNELVQSCGVLVDPEAEGGFAHLATAWMLNDGEWVTSWSGDVAPAASARLILAHSGEAVPISSWEQDEEQPVAGFQAAAAPASRLAPKGACASV